MKFSIKSQNQKNVTVVVISNILTILVSLFTGFILPKELSISDYANYRVYFLYISYAGFFHFGFVNGIYLKYGHLDFDQLPVSLFRIYSRVMLLMQTVVAAVLAVVLFECSGFMDMDKVIAYAFIIINIPLINIKWFYSSVNQFTKRFVIDSCVTCLQNALNLLMVVLLIAFQWCDYRYLLVFISCTNLICMILVMGQNRSLLPAGREHIKNTGVSALIRSGFFLMLSEFVGIIILSIDSIFVENLFSQTDFAMYSFAVSVITVIYALISVVSNLIYPYLVRVEEEKYTEYYTLMSDALAMTAALFMAAFFAAEFIVLKWIDKYESSIAIFAILFGTVLFRGLITLVCGNYFKVLKLIREYTKNNIFAIAVSFLLNIAAYFFLHDYRYIAIASLISFIIWYLVTEALFIRRLQIPVRDCVRRYVFISISLVLFYGIAQMKPVPAFFLYLLAICIVGLLCYQRQIRKLIRIIR